MSALNNYCQPFLGIDIGGTLAKLCFAVNKDFKFSNNHLQLLTSNFFNLLTHNNYKK